MGKSILLEAEQIVNGARQQSYGHPSVNHSRTASFWSAYLSARCGFKVSLSPRDVCLLNILQKVSREVHAPKRDNLVDIAGFAENANLCEKDEMASVAATFAAYPPEPLPELSGNP